MSHDHSSHNEFFTGLSELLSARQGKDHGKVYLTQKRMSQDSTTASAQNVKDEGDILADLHPSSALPIIVRATNGKGKRTRDKKVKLSTIVQPEEIDAFFARYADVCKAGMLALKKRDRKARKTQKTKKKKTPAEGNVKS